MALKLGDGLAVGAVPHLDNGIVAGAYEVFAVGCDDKCPDVVPIGVGDGPEWLAAGLMIPAVDDAKVIGGEQPLCLRVENEL